MIRSVQKNKKVQKRPTKKKKTHENAYWIKLRISVPLQPSHTSHRGKWVAIGCSKIAERIAYSIFHQVERQSGVLII